MLANSLNCTAVNNWIYGASNTSDACFPLVRDVVMQPELGGAALFACAVIAVAELCARFRARRSAGAAQ